MFGSVFTAYHGTAILCCTTTGLWFDHSSVIDKRRKSSAAMQAYRRNAYTNVLSRLQEKLVYDLRATQDKSLIHTRSLSFRADRWHETKGFECGLKTLKSWQ